MSERQDADAPVPGYYEGMTFEEQIELAMNTSAGGDDDAKPPAKRIKLPDPRIGSYQIKIVGHRTMQSGVDENERIIIKFKVDFSRKVDEPDDSSDDDASELLTTSWLGADRIGSIDPSAAIEYLSRCPDIADWQKGEFLDDLRSRRKELSELTSLEDVVGFCCHGCSCGKRRTEMIICTGETIHRKCCHNLIGADEETVAAFTHSLERANNKVTLDRSKMSEDAGGNYGSKSTKHQEKILLEKALKSARSRETRAINDTELADPVW